MKLSTLPALILIVFSSVRPAYAVAPVLDFSDLPVEIKELLTTIQEIKTTIDQLIALYNELEHWHEQAQKLTGRDGFRLRDIQAYYSQNSLSHFYAGDSDVQRLARAIDEGASANEIANQMKEVFPVSPLLRDWETGSFEVTGRLKDVIETFQKAQGLGYGGVAEGLAMVGQARKSYEDNKETYEETREQWEQAEGGEQEALDLIHVQLSQIVDLMSQEQALMTALLNQEATVQNWAMVQEGDSFQQQATLMNTMSRAASGFGRVQDRVVLE